MKPTTKIIDMRGSMVRLFHRGSVLLSKHVEAAVNLQPGFRRELVEQIISITISFSSFSCLARSSNHQLILKGFSKRFWNPKGITIYAFSLLSLETNFQGNAERGRENRTNTNVVLECLKLRKRSQCAGESTIFGFL